MDREQHEQANRTLREKLTERLEANRFRFVLTDTRRLERAEKHDQGEAEKSES